MEQDMRKKNAWDLYLHPLELEIQYKEKEQEVLLLQQQANEIGADIKSAIKNAKTQNDFAVIKKAREQYRKLIISLDKAKKEYMKLGKKLETSMSLHQKDDEVFEYLGEVDKKSIVEAHDRVAKKKKATMGEEIALQRIKESAKEALRLEKSAFKRTKKLRNEAQELLELAEMDYTQRVQYLRKKKIQKLKKFGAGGGLICLASSFFIPATMAYTIPLLATGAVAYLGSKTKPVKNLIEGAKEDTRLLTRELQNYVYGSSTPKQLGGGANQQHFRQPPPQNDFENLYKEMRV